MPQARTGRRRWRDNPAAPQKIPAALVTLLVSRGLDFESIARRTITRLACAMARAAARKSRCSPDHPGKRRNRPKPQGFRPTDVEIEDRFNQFMSSVCGLNASHDTSGFQFVNVPLGLSFHAHTCRV